MKIPIFKLEFENDLISKFNDGCKDIFTSNRPLGESHYVREFEKKFGSLVNSNFAIAVPNGTAAIEVALRSLDINGKVAIPSNTFFATTVATENAGYEFILLDCEKNTFSLCINDLKKKIKSTNIGAVILVHIGGIISSDIKEIRDICNENNIYLIEDAAHAHLSTYDGLSAGTIGEIGCFSFFPTKVMTTGEGGMITTNNESLYKSMKSIKNFGRDLDDSGLCVNPNGINYKINEFTGLLGSLECERVEARIKKRNELVKRYVHNLSDTTYKPILQENGHCSYYKFICMTSVDRSFLRQFCADNNISLTGEVYKIPIHKQPLYREMYNDKDFQTTDFVCNNHICPPLYPELNLNEIDYICDILIKAEKIFEG